MAELLVQDTSVIATADAIREKLGNSDMIEWAANKGFADAISGLGNMPFQIKALAGGTYVPAYNDLSISVNHDLGVVPNFMLVTRVDPIGSTALRLVAVFHSDKKFITSLSDTPQARMNWCINRSSGTDKGTSLYIDDSEAEVPSWNEVVCEANCSGTAQDLRFQAGVTYNWVAGVLDGVI